MSGDIPPDKARDFLRAFLDRNRDTEDGKPFKTMLYMTRGEALNFWAAEKWLGVYEAWGVGVELTDFTIANARTYLGQLVEQLKKQAGAEVMSLTINARGRAILTCAERQLDRYSLHRGFPDRQSTGKWKGKK